MSSFTTTKNDPQIRTQRRLLFEGFNIQETVNSSHRNNSVAMLTSTPDPKLNEKESERLDFIPSNESQSSDPCLLQLQNARQLLHSMSRAQVATTSEQQSVDDQKPRTELFNETNPELAYYKSSLESERNRRKQLETLVDVQQQRLTEAESELIQLRANDHKKTLCMKQLEQMIPNVVDEWKQKEAEYKTKLNSLTQQIKQLEQTNREKTLNEKQQFDLQLNEKILVMERLTKDNENLKHDYESLQSKNKQNEQRIQQLTKDADQAKQRWSTLENDLRNEIKNGETRFNDIQSELDKKQEQLEQTLRDQHQLNNDHQAKIRQLENDLDEQRRENNVLKMELELREAKYRAQIESLKIQMMRDAETKLTQRLEEQHAKHLLIEQELNELHRRRLSDLEEKHEQILSNERNENENRVQVLLSKLDQMKNEVEYIQSTTNAQRQDLAKKLQDVFETTLLKGSAKPNFSQNEIINPSSLSSTSSTKLNQMKLQPSDTQVKTKPIEFNPTLQLTNIDLPANMSSIRSLSSRIDSLVDQTNRVTNGYEFSSHLPSSLHQENTLSKVENNPNHLNSNQPHSALHSPYYRSTPIDPLQEWYPQTFSQPSFHSNNNQLTSRSQSADHITNSGLFSIYPSQNSEEQQQQHYRQQSSSNSLSLDSNLNLNHIYQPIIPSYQSTSSMLSNLRDHQQEVQGTISKDSIENHQIDQASAANDSLTRYVKMLLERSPTQEKKHPLAKTNQSLHDLQLSIDQLNRAERDHKIIVDDLVLSNESHSSNVVTPRQRKSSSSTIHGTSGGAKKRLDYEVHNNKQSNSNELFERLSQPKTRIKKDKPKQQQQQQQQQSTTGAHGVWK